MHFPDRERRFGPNRLDQLARSGDLAIRRQATWECRLGVSAYSLFYFEAYILTRLYYLDNLRSFAMLMGIFVHVTTLAHFGWLEFVATASNHFRMGTFFAVSGFFAGMLLTRRSVGSFLMARFQSLGIPLMFGLLILNPITLLMIYNWRGGSAGLDQLGDLILLSFGSESGVQGHFVWHLHLWFLISLLCYTCAAPLVLRVADRLGIPVWLSRMTAKIPTVILALVVALVISVTVAVWRVLFDRLEIVWHVPWLVRATFSYSPYYVLGLLLHGQRVLWDRLHRVDALLIAVVIGLWVLPTLPGNIGKLEIILRRELTVCASLFSLMAIFQALFSKPGRLGTLLADSIYTVYLLHYMMIYILAFALRPVLPDGSSQQFWVISLLTAMVTLILHQIIQRHAPWVLFVLNGRKVTKAKTTAAV